MSIVFDRNRIDHISQMAAADFVPVKEYGGGHEVDQLSSSSSSSIGRNSDDSSLSSSSGGGSGGGGGGGGEEEVQSEYNLGPLDSLEALEDSLPIKRGISNFYSGKSKSFTSLSEATSCSSIKDIVKPENALTRKRKNLLAHNIYWNKNNHNRLRASSGGITKRTINSRSSVALAAMGLYESNSNSESSNSNSSSPVLNLPPLPPQSRTLSYKEFYASPQHQTFSPWRSFSLSDLQGVDAATSSIVGGFGNNNEKSGKLD
ncbi:hypothetical protein LIER_35894 [Lithospermum erythrorhizon]|uniref:Uncharacterized protein n=1 Tax=Lithospermum erythrorhizon TaxID=34254 RepID=A0AAV3NXT7_LITER